MVRAEPRETRSQEETNWYFSIKVWACEWTREKMHKTSAKLQLNFYLINLCVTFTWLEITLEEICQRNFKYSLIPEYDLSNAPFILNFRVEINKKSIPYIYLNPKSKRISPAGNRTPVSRVTGGDTHHYTTEELGALALGLMGTVIGKRPIPL